MTVQTAFRSPAAEHPLRVRRRRVIAWLSCLAFVLFALPALAVIREVDPGETPRVGTDDGLLLVSVDSNVELGAVRVSREGVNFDVRTLHGVKVGQNVHLYVLPAGHYRWATVSYIGEYRLAKDPEFGFDVKPGVVNYPGDLIFRSTGWWTAIVHVSNRGLQAMDWLESNRPAIFRDQRFVYTGRYPDPFPELYRAAIAQGHAAKDSTLEPPPTPKMPLPLASLWRPSRLQLIELNPAGDLFAEVVAYRKPSANDREKTTPTKSDAAPAGDAGTDKEDTAETGDWYWAVDLVDLKRNNVVRLLELKRPIWRLDWVGDRSVIVSIGQDGEAGALVVANIQDTPTGRTYDKVIVPRPGALVRVLDAEPGRILFYSQASSGELVVHKLDVRSQKAVNATDFAVSKRVDRGLRNAVGVFSDASGRIRLAVARGDAQARVLLYGDEKNYRQIMVLDDESDFEPVALSADGSKIYGLAERDRGQKDLVELDPAAGNAIRTVFSQPGRDIRGPMFSPSGELIGAAYFDNGFVVSHYFRDADEALYRRLANAFPGRATTILQRSVDERKFLVAVGGSDKPSDVYFFDADASSASLVSETKPWLASQHFAPATTLKVKSADGFEIEAYLTLPPSNAGKVPLVVFPHGGPIGVRDNRYFDPEVQVIASLGYAVLQVNFRGSEGYGTAFRKAGEGHYGTAIEDDIDTALQAALAKYPLDDKRMCIVGASYGGYSSMVSSIRWPGRFRCAVSIAGISDQALFFTASDSARSATVRAEMEKAIGNPNTQLDIMQKNSPLYRYRELAVPVLLIHGREDLRVDYEHTRRLVRMLNLAGRPPALIELANEGHGLDDDADKTRVWGAIAGFLRAHLDPGTTAAAPAATPPAPSSAPQAVPPAVH